MSQPKAVARPARRAPDRLQLVSRRGGGKMDLTSREYRPPLKQEATPGIPSRGGLVMQIPVLVERVTGDGYRARSTEPFAVSAKGSTREEALEKLRAKIQTRLKNGTEVVG